MANRANRNVVRVLSGCSALYKYILFGKQFFAVMWSRVKTKCVTLLLRCPGVSVVNLQYFLHRLLQLQRRFGRFFDSHLIAFSSINFQRLQLNLNGSVYSISTFLSEFEMQHFLVNLYNDMSTNELHQLCLMIEQNEPIVIVKKTLPPSPLTYEPRTLFRHFYLDKQIFTKNYEDIFVISGMGMRELCHMVKPDMTAYSGDQIDEVTAKFILLEKVCHWFQILVHAKHPVHLLAYDPDEDVFTLKKTYGTSNMMKIVLGTNYEASFEISEGKLLRELQKSGNIRTDICICDSPGMGKSFLMGNLARLAIQQKGDLVVYIKVLNLLEEPHQSFKRNLDFKQAAEFLIHHYATPAGSARKIMQALYEVKKTMSISLFLDGLDEVSLEDQEWTKHLLNEIKVSFSNVKLYVAARSHMRPELEKRLGFTTYGILPLSHQSEVNLIIAHLKDKNKKFQTMPYNQLQNWVTIGIATFRQYVQHDDCTITGIPLQCRLIAEVILNTKRIHNLNILGLNPLKITTILGYSLFDLYKNHVELHYHKHIISVSKNCDRKSGSYSEKYIANSGAKIAFQVFALQTVFPSFARSILSDSSPSIHEISETFYKIKNGFFTHQTIAEYLVAEFIADYLESAKNVLKTSNCRDPSALTKLLKFLFGTVLATTYESSHLSEISETLTVPQFKSHQFSFYYHSVVYFLNGHIFTKNIHNDVFSKSVKLMLSEIGTETVTGILQSSIRHDFVNIYDFVANLLVSHPQKYHLDMSKNQLNTLVRLACKYSRLELFKKLNIFIKTNYSVSLQDLCNFCLENSMFSIAQYVCLCVSFEKLKYLFEMGCQTKNQKLLYICAENSVYDSNELHEKRVNIINWLIRQNEHLILEKDDQGKTPLFAQNSSIDILELLINKGADVTATVADGKTMAHLATKWMSASAYHQLVLLLVNQSCHASLFTMKDDHGNTPLHCALLNVKSLRWDTADTIHNEMERLSHQEKIAWSCIDNQSDDIVATSSALATIQNKKLRQQQSPDCEEYAMPIGKDCKPFQNSEKSNFTKQENTFFANCNRDVVANPKNAYVDPSTSQKRDYSNEVDTNIIQVREFTKEKGFFTTAVHNKFWADQDVMVKKIRLQPGNFAFWDNENSMKIIRECCHHENIAKYYSINLCKKKLELEILKEYYKLSLEHLIKNESKVKTSNESKDILLQTTTGLAFLHGKNIIHGNLKPENIFVVQLSPKEIRVKLADMEISQIVFKQNQNILFSTKRSSVDWTAPETVQTRNMTTRLTDLQLSMSVDIFSLGCIFYYVLSNGSHPFGSNSDEIESNISANKTMIQPEKLEGSCVGYLNLIFLMIDENPESRPPTEVIKRHHIFWSRKVSLNFLVSVSNAADQPLEGSLISKCLDQIEKHPLMIIYCEPEGSTGWMRFLCKDVQMYVQGHGCKRKPYCGDLIFDLLRAIRNMQTHYMTLPPAVKNRLGEIHSSFCEYWLLRFPLLVDLVWLTFQKLRNDTSCGLSDYYCNESSFSFAEYSENERKLLGRYVRVRSASIILHGKIL